MSSNAAPGASSSWLDRLKADFLASIVVFLVALPLCMGIAIASGAPPEKALAVGMITGIIGGLVVGLIGGSPLQVSGPAAGLSVLVFEQVQRYGWERIGLVVLAAGGFQLLAGVLGMGQWFRAVSPAVIYGMLAGIGILIIGSQFHIMVDDQPRGSGLQNLLSLPEALWKGINPTYLAAHDDAARIGLLTIVLIVLWKALAPKKLKVIPAALIAVTTATLATALLELPIKTIVVPDSLFGAIQLPTMDTLTNLADPAVLTAGASLAFIASAETLLCATAVDKMHNGVRTRYDLELGAQGVGNMMCGVLGALPMTGVIVRSATNIEAGGKTRLSAMLHGVWLLGLVCLCPFVLRWIPTASLAALLVYTGYKLVDPQAIRTLLKYGKSEVAIYAATVVMIVATDLLTGVLVGIGASVAKLLHTFSRLKIRLVNDTPTGKTILYLRGAATFLRLPKLAGVLESIPGDTELHVHFEELSYIDHACLDLFLSWQKQHEASGGTLEIDWDSLHARFSSYGKSDKSSGYYVSQREQTEASGQLVR